MNGDGVRSVRFPSGGYDADQVDELLRRVAAELDAGRAVEPIITSTRFRWRAATGNSGTFASRAGQTGRGYDTEAVDWFLDQLRRETCLGLDVVDMDRWRGLPVADYVTRPATDGLGAGAASRVVPGSGEPQDHGYFSRQDCQDAWQDFPGQPGTRLQWAPTGILRRALRTAERKIVASVNYVRLRRGELGTAHTGGRSFTWERVTRSKWPDVAGIVGPSVQESELCRYGPAEGRGAPVPANLGVLADETGTPVLYTSGMHRCGHAGAVITFPDQRCLFFPVRSSRKTNAIMTAVDQAGNKVARYRFARKGPGSPVEITVHPGQQLTEQLVLAIAVSVPGLRSFFWYPPEGHGGGGGPLLTCLPLIRIAVTDNRGVRPICSECGQNTAKSSRRRPTQTSQKLGADLTMYLVLPEAASRIIRLRVASEGIYLGSLRSDGPIMTAMPLARVLFRTAHNGGSGSAGTC